MEKDGRWPAAICGLVVFILDILAIRWFFWLTHNDGGSNGLIGFFVAMLAMSLALILLGIIMFLLSSVDE